MLYNLKTARLLIESFKEKEDWKIEQVRKLFAELEKKSEDMGVEEIIQSPYYQNIVNILGPYAVYYKIDQVLKLLEELGKQRVTPEVTKSPYYMRPVYPG